MFECVPMYVCLHACMHECMIAWVHVCVFASMYVRIYADIVAHLNLFKNACYWTPCRKNYVWARLTRTDGDRVWHHSKGNREPIFTQGQILYISSTSTKKETLGTYYILLWDTMANPLNVISKATFRPPRYAKVQSSNYVHHMSPTQYFPSTVPTCLCHCARQAAMSQTLRCDLITADNDLPFYLTLCVSVTDIVTYSLAVYLPSYLASMGQEVWHSIGHAVYHRVRHDSTETNWNLIFSKPVQFVCVWVFVPCWPKTRTNHPLLISLAPSGNITMENHHI